LALHALAPKNPEVLQAAIQGITWTLDLVNSDGGVPTFCKGWNRLPFDRSAPDITAHCLSAWAVWLPVLPAKLQRRTQLAIARGLRYLQRKQEADGSWNPLWFGNEWHPNFRNPVYGTARVVLALARMKTPGVMADRAVKFLLSAQAVDGTCSGGPGLPHPSIEETALTLDAWGAAVQAGFCLEETQRFRTAIQAGIAGLDALTQGGTSFPAKPMGFYFATLWYSEALYPGLFALQALGRARKIVNLGNAVTNIQSFHRGRREEQRTTEKTKENQGFSP
jgi:squalene-hopene/tetraprenyl-beta-curcumene cyclase